MNAPYKILIVEDEAVLSDVFKLILESGGYDVLTASNGLKGIELLRQHSPHLILLDLFMPVMDGREVLRNIDVTDYPQTKIIVYSNLSDQHTEAEMLSLGAHAFLLKSSMTPRDLLAFVKTQLPVAP